MIARSLRSNHPGNGDRLWRSHRIPMIGDGRKSLRSVIRQPRSVKLKPLACYFIWVDAAFL
jgi:hypothetical protein